MPGLSQLKQFEKDILSIGDESTLRASRGEKPVLVPIPKNITVDNDADDFVLGMPEQPLEKKESVVDDDLSDITGAKSSSSSSTEADASNENVPDLSSLLAPTDFSDSSDSGPQEMPDLSMFMDAPIEEEAKPEVQEPVEVSVADMGLEALLAGAGFDGSEGASKEPEEAESIIDDFEPEEVKKESPKVQKTAEPIEPVKAPEPEKMELPPELAFLNATSEPEPAAEAIPEPAPIEDFSEPEDFSTDDFSAADFGTDNIGTDSFDLPEVPDFDEVQTDDNDFSADLPAEDFEDIPSFDDIPVEIEDISEPAASSSDSEEVSLSDFGFDMDAPEDKSLSKPSAFTTEPTNEVPLEAAPVETTDVEDFNDVPAGLFDASDLDLPDISFGEDESAQTENTEKTEKSDIGSFDEIDLDSIDEESASEPVEVEMPDFGEDIPDYEDSGKDEGSDDFEVSDEPLETFDTTGMEDIDFGVPETDASLGNETDDFSMDSLDFEIPGFSDVNQPVEEKKAPPKKANLDIPDFSKAIPGNELPPNTLSDEQYKTFVKNFAEYPLNVRLAFEDLIVQNEFTDDAEFELIEKILNKAPARQVASMLEKMLDISIPVPRDYEHRTAAEYEAYKQSVQYQLKNKILPGILIGMLGILLFWGLFNFTKNCIYIPAKASKYYREGYALLEADEYSQAQVNFDKAASYKMKKKWFFKFARGYRERKQYYSAADIYQKTLIYFNHDKQAGLEYADMELNDLSNYSNAEEIVRRQVLDYHVNDADGILMLGDVFLEWGTERDPAKLEDAKEQYLKLLQLYKPTNLYNSRMMRYYIRSDNLQQVITYQKMFEQDEKSLEPRDWTELSGYLLEKLYGPLSPSEENLRYQIEGVRKLLVLSATVDKDNPVAYYNLSNYYINTNEVSHVEKTLQQALDKFSSAKQLNKREIYKYIDAYRLLGENYVKTNDYLQAQEQYINGITLYTMEKESTFFEGNEKIGKLYADLADINYLLAGDYDNAAVNYKSAVNLGYDNPSIRYRLGYMSYIKKNYQDALGSFMKAGEGNVKVENLLFAMGNTLALRNDDYAAEGYFEQLINRLDDEVNQAGGSMYPQTNTDQHDLVTLYLYAANNYGVVLHKIARRTGNSQKNAQSIVQFQQSLRAWDSLTRNQTSMKRLEGSNLAAENIKYITHPVTDFEPSIYLDIPKTLTDQERL